ncbi:hypothetical protein NDU88_004281 [Pleurodeles waltl]|uniref:Uncharacterized protein n=1 Tax=Pleurodeles waltl TaxID=8319 RepID=A0AAV7V2L0_PLEWA|nr:hypothetical protein NDU88_004281 [Pleurodeles waltl]
MVGRWPTVKLPCRGGVEPEHDKLEQMDVIEQVTRPTQWISHLVITEKTKQPGAIRLDVDMRCGQQTLSVKPPKQDDKLKRVAETIEKNGWKLFLQDAEQWDPVEKTQLAQLWKLRDELSSAKSSLEPWKTM